MLLAVSLLSNHHAADTAILTQRTMCPSIGIQNPKTAIILKLFNNCSKVYFKTNASGRRLLSLITRLRISVTAACATLRLMAALFNYQSPR
jgi:hypothetical protein